MKDLRLVDIVKCLVIGDTVIAREELVDIWNRENPSEPATYELPVELTQNE